MAWCKKCGAAYLSTYSHRCRGTAPIGIKPHERMALESLSRGPDRIRYIENDETFAAAVVYCDLEKRGLVTIDKDDGMLVTISPAGTLALSRPLHDSPKRKDQP